MIKVFKLALILLFAVVIASCGQDAEYEYYGADLLLTQANHGRAWGRTDCFSCHVRSNIHRVDHNGYGDGFMTTARSSLSYDTVGLVIGCSTCHQGNGVN